MHQAIMLKVKRFMRTDAKKRRGQTLVEYALILAFISIVAIVVLQALGTKVTQVFTTVNGKMDVAMSSS